MKKFWSMLLCACLTLTGCAANVGEPVTRELELDRHVPDGGQSHADVVSGMRDLCASAQDAMARMLAEAEGKGEREAQAAQRAREACEARLGELSELDYDAMEDAQVFQYMEEVSGIITTLREARDIINGLE